MAEEDEALERVASIPSAGRGQVRLDLLAVDGVEEGRARFERLVTDVVKVILGDAREVAARPGDWGIDTFSGVLSGGGVAIWQSKFFLQPGNHADAQQRQIRESYKSATSNIDALGLKLASWTLAVPGTMDAAMTVWFDGWRKREQAKRKREGKSIVIDVWQEADVRGYLMKPDFQHLRSQYFGADPVPSERSIEDLADPNVYDTALFIHQLHEAGVRSDRAARTAFFNAEVMTRDINERESTYELTELRGMRATVEQMWSSRFEEACDHLEDRSRGRLPGLFPGLCSAIEDHHKINPNRALRDTLVHRIGLAHHLAEDGRIGWVAHFDEITTRHREANSA